MAVRAALDTPELLNIPELRQLRLDQLCQSPRYKTLERLGLYAEGRQDGALVYNWDGTRQGYAGEADIRPGWYVPLVHRKPNVRYNLGKLITGRLTAMALGEESWPQITVPGDSDAEDYVQALAEEAGLQQILQEARTKGGGMGTAVLSFSFVEGAPRVKNHEAKHMFPVRWKDKDEHILASVLKVYAYSRTVWTEGGAPREKLFYFVRYWDEQTETVWEPIPQELAQTREWSWKVASKTVRHGYGECPVYWAQNLEDSEREDGVSDIDGLEDTFDQVNRLLSATTKGTIANVDPTLVIKDDAGKNQGVVHKGTGHAIFAKGGADWLELKGESVKTAKELAGELVRYCLNTAGVVIGDPEKMGVKAQSSLALKMLYLPMCNQCDLLRVQYGALIVALLRGMLRAAKQIGELQPGPVLEVDGYRLQHKPVVILPPRIEVEGEGDEKTETEVPRTPGESERIELKWPQYFPPSLPDIKLAVDAAVAAQGRTISRKTGVGFTASMFGVTDIDEELALIDTERAEQAELMGELDSEDNVPGFAKGNQDGGSEE